MSVGVLASVADSRVVSFEPSPNVLSFLQSSMAASPFRERWILVPKAVGAKEGKASFSLSAAENSEFDGIKNTRRVHSMKQVEVEMTTVDREWRRLGSPVVSVLKCDVEGGELAVLRGARDCLRANRPAVLVEWNRQNLEAYNIDAKTLVDFAVETAYQLFAVPTLVRIQTAEELRLHMILTENFLLIPRDKSGASATAL
jgi:FkbM family methyltransferase